MATNKSDKLAEDERQPHSGETAATATAAVADALSDLVQHQLTPGMSLPSEAELAIRFSVSRLTVREAVKMLAGRGLLDVGRGRRAVVREPDGSAFADFLVSLIQRDPKGLFDLIELRKSLEVQSAGLAAKRSSRASLVALETALQGMREAAIAGDDAAAAERRFNQWDVGFHEALATASGNRVLAYLLEAMAIPLRESFRLSRRGHHLRGGTVQETIAAHAAILDGVRSGRPRAAADAMRSHLEDTERDIRAGLGGSR